MGAIWIEAEKTHLVYNVKFNSDKLKTGLSEKSIQDDEKLRMDDALTNKTREVYVHIYDKVTGNYALLIKSRDGKLPEKSWWEPYNGKVVFP